MESATGTAVDGATGALVDCATGAQEAGALVGQEETGIAEGDAVVAALGLQLPLQGRHCE